MKEYPGFDDEPCYPYPTKEYLNKFKQYEEDMEKENNILFDGRLAQYKYLNMDLIVKNALETFENEILWYIKDTMTYKISVIVPIFNAENDLKNAINSVINQTIGFENIELILVDDCSTDNSKNIINYYLTKYPNIKAIFLKNTGNPSKPRNIGIDKSTGEYLMFLDSDDFFVKIIVK